MKKKLKNSALLPVACLCIAWPLAHAQNVETGDTLQFRVGGGIEHDSNVLRGPTDSSDTVTSVLAGARYDKRLSLQRIVLDAEIATHKFNDYSALDYTTLDYSAAWNYAFTPRFTGVLSATQREFRDTTVSTTGINQANVRTERRQLLEGTYRPGGGWLAQAGLSHTTTEAEIARALDASPEVSSVLLGTGYEFASGTSAIVQYRRGDGEYDNLLADFKENELSVIARWPITGKTTLSGSLGYLERNHDANPALDFDGVVGNVNAEWEITGKTSLVAGFARNLGSYEAVGGGYVRGWTAFVEPIWRATAKTAVRLRYQHENRNWLTLSPAALDAGRDDGVNALALSVDWEPVRNVVVTGLVRRERRDSNIDAFDFTSTTVGVAARYSF